MKRLTSGGLVVILILLMSVFASAQGEDQTAGTIHVVGHGQVRVQPDVAYVQVGVEVQAGTAVDAQRASSLAMQNIIDTLAKMDISKNDIQTDYFYLNPDRRYNREKETEETVGYRAVNQLSITVRDISALGQVIDACIAAGANQVHSVRYGVQETTELENQALQAAVQEATRKARVIAAASNVQIKGIVSIAEGGISPGYGAVATSYKSEMMLDRAMPVEPGQIAVQAMVQIVFSTSPVAAN